MAKVTLFELKEKLCSLNDAIAEDAAWIAEKAADPATDMKLIDEKTAHRDGLIKRKELLQKEHDDMELAQRTSVAIKGGSTADDAKAALVKAKAEFYKTAITGGDVMAIRKTYEGLGAIPENTAVLGYGENLLPSNMTTELITEPFETNSLRNIEQVSQITGLEEPKLLFDIEDADLADVTDEQTAKEIAMDGDTVQYGRFKTKIVATVKDTVLHGTQLELVSTIENALRSGLAQKEKMRAFATTPDSVHDHMSFYLNDIESVAGDNMIDAIINAIGSLPDTFSENASVVMRKADYLAALKILANNNATLWGKKPEDVIGYPVVFNDRAIVPVIGDFRYARQNYDIGTTYETDKDAKKGEYYFVLTAWGDHRIKLKSAFRLARVRVMLIGAAIEDLTTPAAPAAGDSLKATGVFNDGGDGTDGTITYQWQYLNGATWTDCLIATWASARSQTLATVDNQDEGVSFRCVVKYSDDDGAPTTAITSAIEDLA